MVSCRNEYIFTRAAAASHSASERAKIQTKFRAMNYMSGASVSDWNKKNQDYNASRLCYVPFGVCCAAVTMVALNMRGD